MAYPTCPKPGCDGRHFSMTTIEPSGSAVKVQAVHCSKCGAVVGISDYWNVGGLVRQIAEKLGV
jgi:hypothetical protein